MPRLPPNSKVLKAVRPNLGIEAAYRAKLNKLIREMHTSVNYWVKATYGANAPRIAMDATPASVLKKAVDLLVKRWTKRFDDAAEQLADYFSTAVEERSSATLRKILKDAGWTVKFTMTAAMRDVFQATINQNVALIKSIPAQYLSDVEGMVQRSVQAGGDMWRLAKDLEKRYQITRRRAALIARDQNHKATSMFNRVREQELGITQNIWMHSHAGREPRPTHVAMNNKPYDVAKGMWDSAEGAYVWPGQLINCRCSSKPVVEGLR